MMENYVCISVCAVILSVCGCLDGLCSRAGLRRSDVAFAALCVAALSGFRFKPIIEFDIDIAALALPAVLGLLSIDREKRAARTLALLALVSSLPILASAAYMLYALHMTTYAYFALRAETVCLAQLALCALTLAVASFRFAEEKAV